MAVPDCLPDHPSLGPPGERVVLPRVATMASQGGA